MQKRGCGVYLVVALLLTIFCIQLSVFVPQQNCFSQTENSALVVHFIDVGQGDSTFVELPDSKTMLIDAGEASEAETVCDYISSLGYEKIDYLIATHADSDHIGGFGLVLEKFEVQTIYRPFTPCNNFSLGFVDELYTMFSSISTEYMEDSFEYANFLKLAYSEKCDNVLANIKVCSTNEQFVSSSVDNPYLVRFFMPEAVGAFNSFRILNGSVVNLSSDNNSSSAVIGLFTENQKYLFCGDVLSEEENRLLEKVSENIIIQDQLKDISVLKVSHHGSNSSSVDAFINYTSPKYSVISVGKNSYGHPSGEVLSRLGAVESVVYRTDKNGTIKVVEELGELTISVEKTGDDSKKYVWIFYVVLGAIAVSILVMIFVYPKIKEKKTRNKQKSDNNSEKSSLKC